MTRTRRWIGLLGASLIAENKELTEAVTRDDGRTIVAWLEKCFADSLQELSDFRRSHGDLESRTRHLNRLLDLDRADYGDDEDELERRFEDSAVTRELLHDGELDWYQDQIKSRLWTVSRWRRCLTAAKDIAGIELIPDGRRYGPSEEPWDI